MSLERYRDNPHGASEADGRRSLEIVTEPARFTVRDPPGDVDALLYDTLAWEDPDAQWSDAYQNGRWDGMRRLYDRQEHSAPIGLLDRARDALEAEGYAVDVTDHRNGGGRPIDVGWYFPHDLREYQRTAVRSVLDAGGGLVSLPTGAGKTVVALRLILELGRNAVVFVHTQELLYQWADRVCDTLDVEPGVIGDGEWSEGPVTVAIMQTLLSRGTDDLNEYDVAVFDECHRTSAAETFHDVGQAVDAPLRVGLSATPWRKVDGEALKIEGAVGGVAFEVGAAKLIDASQLARPEWAVIDPAGYGAQATANDGEGYQSAYTRCVVECEARNRAVAQTAARLGRDGRRVLVSISRIEHGERLADRLAGAQGVSATFLCGEDTTDRRKQALEAFGAGEIDVLVSTLVREGVDLPAINAVVLAGAGKSKVDKIQTIGRALRPENGETATVVDVRDRDEYLGEHFEIRQAAFRAYYGEYGPTTDGSVQAVRRWLDANGVPTDELSLTEQPGGGVRIVVSGYIDDFDHFIAVMRETDAIRYDPEDHSNYVDDVDRLDGCEVVA